MDDQLLVRRARKVADMIDEFSLHQINVIVKRYFTDVNGTIIDKSTVASNLQVKFPFFMLGAFDMAGGYATGLNVCPPDSATPYIGSFINGFPNTTSNITGVNPLNTIQANLFVGDIVHVFTDSLNSPNVYIWIVQHSPNKSLGAIIQNLATTSRDNKYNRLIFKTVAFQSASVLQYDEAMFNIHLNNIGDKRYDNFVPNIWRTPYNALADFIRMGVDIKGNQFYELATYMLFTSDTLNFNFEIVK